LEENCGGKYLEEKRKRVREETVGWGARTKHLIDLTTLTRGGPVMKGPWEETANLKDRKGKGGAARPVRQCGQERKRAGGNSGKVGRKKKKSSGEKLDKTVNSSKHVCRGETKGGGSGG